MPKKDTSTSCNDFCLDSSLCNHVFVEKVIIDICTQEVAMENEQLKQEVAHLTKDLIQVQGKTEQSQLHQITPSREWRSLMKDKPWFATCDTRKITSPMSARWRMGEELRRKRKTKKEASKLTNTYTNKVDKKASTPYLSWRRKMTRWWPSRWTSKPTIGPNAFGCQRRSFPTWRAPRRFGSRKGSEVQWTSENLETWQSLDVFHGVHYGGQNHCQVS